LCPLQIINTFLVNYGAILHPEVRPFVLMVVDGMGPDRANRLGWLGDVDSNRKISTAVPVSDDVFFEFDMYTRKLARG
jgi:hypothetical protein